MIIGWTMSGKRMERHQVTVRELSGAIWAELASCRDRGEAPFDQLRPALLGPVTDLVMGVIARYAGVQIVNDSDLPVDPLPRPVFQGDYEPDFD